jgi:hypothetical protein
MTWEQVASIIPLSPGDLIATIHSGAYFQTDIGNGYSISLSFSPPVDTGHHPTLDDLKHCVLNLPPKLGLRGKAVTIRGISP